MPANRYVRFNIVFFASIVAFLAFGMVGVVALDRAGHLPPPPLTATSCIDEKFKFIRDHANDKPDLLAVGSSVTWRNLDFTIIQNVSDFERPLNGAPCYLHMHETAWLSELYLDHFPSVRMVATVLAMRDFEACEGDGRLFDEGLGEAVMFDGLPKELLYFVNFRPLRLLKDVRRIADMRSGANAHSPLVMDHFGSGPLTLTPPDPRENVTVSPECFRHLKRMAADLERRKVRWLVALMPPMPAWQARYDPEGERDADWRLQVRAALRGSNTVVIDGRNSPFTGDRYFVDPAHYRWRYAASFTRWIFEEYDAVRDGAATARME